MQNIINHIKDFNKQVVYINKDIKIKVNINFENNRLSISADGYDKRDNRWVESFGGQSYDELLENFPETAWLVEIWKRWHLNDMNAGDEVQETYLRTHGRGKDYDETRAILDKVGLLTHDGYEYGTEWKFEEVPTNILVKLKNIN